MSKETEPKFVPQMTFADFDRMFPNEQACWQYLYARRWPNGVRCPRCGNDHVYASKARPWHWQCMKCGPKPRSPYRFSLRTGTVFEETKTRLIVWFKVLFLMLTAKKGISALQVHRMMGFGSYKTAWYLCMRLRAAMHDPDFQKLMGIVEVDETYFGGKRGNKHVGKRDPHERGPHGKAVVIGAIARKGSVVAQMVQRVDTETVERFIDTVVDKRVRLVSTDESPMYRRLTNRGYVHQSVDHKNEKYVIGVAHTNTIESFWSLMKRGVMGSFHNVSKKYLPLYLAEFQFRFNNRKNADIFGTAIAGC
jgi:transposase-like protein